jgi:hypothetical protein
MSGAHHGEPRLQALAVGQAEADRGAVGPGGGAEDADLHAGPLAEAEVPHGARGLGLGEDALVAVGVDGGARRGEGGEQLALGAGDLVDAAQALQVDGADVDDHAHLGLGDAGQVGDLAAGRHAHLDDGVAVLGPEAEEGEGEAEVVVEVALGPVHPLLAGRRREHAGHQLLGGGLAVGAGDADDAQAAGGERAAVRAGQAAEGGDGVVYLDDRDVTGQREVGGAAAGDHQAGGAREDGLGGEVVPVVALAADGEPQAAGQDGAPVDGHAAVEGAGDAGGDQVEREGMGAAHAGPPGAPERASPGPPPSASPRATMASRATARSSKGCLVRPMIW